MKRVAFLFLYLMGCDASDGDEDDDGSCEVDGEVYEDGESIPSDHYCRRCWCEEGEVECNTDACT